MPRLFTPPRGLPLMAAARVGAGPGTSAFQASSSGTPLSEPPSGLHFAAGAVSQDAFVVDLAHDVVWGYVNPGDTITVSRTADGAYGAAEVDGVGFFWTPVWQLDGQPADVAGGDVLEVYVNGVLETTISPRAVSGGIDILADQVVGAIHGDNGGTPVTITVGLEGAAPVPGAPQQSTATDPDGTFTVSFNAVDLGAESLVAVDYLATGERVVRGYLYPRDPVFLVQQFYTVLGYAEPGQEVTATAYRTYPTDVRWQSTTTAQSTHGWYALAGGEALEAGDVVEVDLGGGTVVSTTLPDFGNLSFDTALDEVYGTAPSGRTVRVSTWQWQDDELVHAHATDVASGGVFTATFHDADMRVRDWVVVSLADDLGNQTQLDSGAPFLDVFLEPTNAFDGVNWRVDGPNLPVTLSIQTDTGVYTRERPIGPSDLGNTGGANLVYLVWGPDWGPINFSPGDTVTLRSPTMVLTKVVPEISYGVDQENDSINGQAPDGDMEITAWQWQGNRYPIHGSATQTSTASSPYAATFDAFDLRDGGSLEVRHFDAASDFGTYLWDWDGNSMPFFQVEPPWGVGGVPPSADEVVTATLYDADGTPLASTSDDHEDNPWYFWLDDFGAYKIEAGHWITVTSESGWTAGLQVPVLTMEVDPDTELAWGQAPESLLFIEHYQDRSWSQHFVPGGDYTVDWSAFGRDVRKGDWLAATYQAPNGNRVRRRIEWLSMRVNYGHDWVEGNLKPGHTLWLTVTESDGSTVKATAELQSQEIPGWGGNTGFSTNLDDPWAPSRPDIQPGDWVYLTADDGRSTTVHVGTINGDLDLDADTIAGTVHAPWFTDTLQGWCGVWEENGPGQGFEVDPDGGSYSCDFGAMGWDLLPGHDVGVRYREPDGDEVYNVFKELAPDIRVEKWGEGNEVAPGGPVVFTIRYRNDGGAVAQNILLTDTLPAGTSYVDDSSGALANVEEGVVTWTLGPLDPGEEERFQLVLTNTADPGDTLRNQVDIYVRHDEYDWNNHAETTVHVTEGQPDLYAWKHPNPGDPAPGETLLYEIDYGNYGPVTSGPAVLTETLPPGTSLVSWYSRNSYDLWQEVATDADKLVLTAPAVPGHWGDRIYLRLAVGSDVPIGTQLTNNVEISTVADSDPGNNEETDDVWVSEPRWDARLDKHFNWARLTPGGEVGYNFYIRNDGNMAAECTVTDTLPVGTSFDEAWLWTGWVSVPFPPDRVGEGVAVWNLGLVEPGQWFNLYLRLDIDGDTSASTILTNCAEIVIDGDDESLYNNADCVARTVQNPGPNLEIDKSYQWNREGQLEYTIDFRNLGTTTLYDVGITDTLRANTAFNGNWWHWFWEGIDFAQVDDQLVWTISRLEPGWSSGLRFQVNLDESITGDQGLAFTNTAEAAILDDVYPADNHDQVTAYTGPDLFAEKWISEGEPQPGERITFTVRAGNANQWPWEMSQEADARLIERLPAGMSYVRSLWPDGTPYTPFFHDPDAGLVTWDMGHLGGEEEYLFHLVVDLDADLKSTEVLLNRLEIEESPPIDVDPNPENNLFVYPVIEPNRVFLPLVLKQ